MLIGGLAMGLAACGKSSTMTASRTPPLDVDRLAKEIPPLVQRARPGVLGFGLMNLESGQSWTVEGARPFPMQSVFKAPLAAAALAEVDAGRLRLDEVLNLEDVDLSPPWSPIADAWPARRDYTVGDLLRASIVDSDNTAADVLMRRIGGPGAVTAWLLAKHLGQIRVDRYERELQPEAHGMASFRASWKGQAFMAARAAVPPDRRMAAMRAALTDPRDSATPTGILNFLAALDAEELISAASTARLIQLMIETPRGAERLKAGLPAGARFAHKIGTSGQDLGLSLAYNDMGILSLNRRRSYAIVAFLSGSTAPEADQAALFAELGRVVARSIGPVRA